MVLLMVNGAGAWGLCGQGFCICGEIIRDFVSLRGFVL